MKASILRHGFCVAAALAMGLALSGCGGGFADLPAATPAITSGPEVPAGSNEDFIVNVGRRVFFAENSAEIGDAGKDTLKLQLEWLQRYKSYKIKIEGFADEPGSADANLKLGARRADAVKAWFLASGFPVSRLRTKTFGNSRPVNKCNEQSCFVQNRRVVTVLDTEVGS